MTKDLVSVIIPVYNRENVIEECLNSVFAQSYQNFEIIIVDDGSSDGTYKICERLAAKDERIKLFAAKHGGVSAARNLALEKSDGEYVFFIDSDDVIYPLLLETLVDGMKNTGAQIGGTNVVGVAEKNWQKVCERLAEVTERAEIAFNTHEETLEAVFCQKSPLGCIGGVMIRSDLIGDTRFMTDLFIGEDFYFIYENLIKNASSVFLDKKWYYVRYHKTNSSWNYNYDGFLTRFRRRELVWKSEESFGRTKYANIQKRDAFSCYTTCFRKNDSSSSDVKKMIKTMKEDRSELLPAFSLKQKVIYFLYVYFPSIARLLFKAKS